MISKEYINELKNTDNLKIKNLLHKHKDISSIIYILENLGQLPENFETEFLYELFSHPHPSVRLNAVKNIAKLNGKSDTVKLLELYKTEKDTSVKREIISAIGRQRKLDNKSFLFKCLNEDDPKIVCQAIRGLLVFENDKEVEKKLKSLINHPNEMVRNVIYKEYFAKHNTSKSNIPHSQTYDFLKNIVVNDDVLKVLSYVPDESIHLTFTSPPYYNARDYSIYPSYQDYLEFLDKVFKETHRITKEGRFLIVNTSPIIIPRVSRSHSSKRYGIPFDLHHYLVNSGWEFIDDIIWLKPEASVKNRVGGFMQHRKPLAYKPNCVTEYLMVYRKATDKLLDWNIHSYDKKTVDESKVLEDFETSNVWKIDPTFDKVHSAIFPVELCKRVIKFYSFKGDLVFDPFGGSGTLGFTANKLERYFFMTEQNEVYFDYMKKKLAQQSIFNDFETRFLTLDEFRGTINDIDQ